MKPQPQGHSAWSADAPGAVTPLAPGAEPHGALRRQGPRAAGSLEVLEYCFVDGCLPFVLDASLAQLEKRAALLVAMGQPALARNDYDRVLELDAENAEAQKYFNLANYGTGFDPYEVLGVPRGADGEAISLAFRRLAKQWHPDRWVNAPDAERLEAETRFKQLNLAQGVLADKAKRKKYDEGTASVADLMIGFWEKLTQKRSRRKRSTIAAGA